LYLWVTGLLKRVAKVMCRTCHSRVFGLNIHTYIRIGGWAGQSRASPW
jgi:hypothetical protein